MTGVQALIDEIEAAFRTGTADGRARVLRRITAFFISGASTFTPAQIDAFDDLMCGVVDKIEGAAVAELSASLAALDRAPPRLCRRLSSYDAIAIAGPLLAQSPLVADGHLVEVAQGKSQLHLKAIAGRPRLDEKVCDALIERGGSVVLAAVACNGGARLSTRGYRRLLDRAATDHVLALAVATRSDLTPEMFEKLVARATAMVQQRLRQRPDRADAKRISAGAG